jgi:hypothetical protein
MSFPQTLVIPNLYVGVGTAEMEMKSDFCSMNFVGFCEDFFVA